MRKSFDSLSGIVRNELRKNPLSGDIFIFVNRKGNQVKLLHWEGDGFSLYYKRLEQGTYEIPPIAKDGTHAEIKHDVLHLILQGVSLKSVQKRKRYKDTYVGARDSSKVENEGT